MCTFEIGLCFHGSIAWSHAYKLVHMTQLQLDQVLMACFTGSQVWAYAHGIDDRQVEPPKSRKSVGAECNWGIRFQNDADALAFMDNLAGELSTRMKGGPLSL